MTLGGIDSGCKWPGKANQWYTSHHIAEDLDEGRMHARWATVLKASRTGLEQVMVPLGVDGKAAGAPLRKLSRRTEENRGPLRKRAGISDL